MPIPSARARAWALAIPAILTHINRARHDFLGGGPPGSASSQNARAILENSWGIHDKAELASMVQWLENAGANEGFREAERYLAENPGAAAEDPKMAHIAKHRGALKKNGLMAWDLCRVVSLVGWGACCGMLTEEEAWGWILPSAMKLQKAYGSWAELGEGYTLGCAYWSLDHEKECRDAMSALLDDAESPWRRIPWKTDLSATQGGSDEDEEGGGSSMLNWVMRGASCLLGLAVVSAVLLGMIGLFGYILWEIAASSGAGGATASDWDGSAPLVCEGNDEMAISGVTTAFEAGPVVLARANCHLTLEGVSLEAPVALQVEGNAVVAIAGGRLAGTEAALRVQGNATVTMAGTEVVGPVDKSRNATVVGP